MKIFSWIRNKRSGNEVANKSNPKPSSYHNMHESFREEFSDWPNGLLAIGTFGNNNNNNLKREDDDDDDVDNTRSDQELDEDKELRVLLNQHMISVEEKHNPAAEELLDCLYKENDVDVSEKKENDDPDLQWSSSIVHRGRKEMRSNSHRKGIGRKSLSFLIKKAFLCRGGFNPAPPVLRDPLHEYPTLDHSRMDKILRAMLHKKIYPQRPTTPKKYLDMPEINGDEDDEYEEGNHESKWVKTDSEYIVLEI